MAAMQLFRQCIATDPNFASAHAGLAYTHIHAATGFQSGEFMEMLRNAEASARTAIALDRTDAEARSCFGLVLHMLGDHEGARLEAQRGVSRNPNLAVGHGILGEILLFSGHIEDGIAELEHCIALDPFGPNAYVHSYLQAAGHYFLRNYEASCKAAKRAVRSHPDYPPSYRWLAAALAQIGRLEEAGTALDTAMAMAPAGFDIFARRRAPWIRPEDHSRMVEGLVKAGWKA
jgi:adenylate cyclase